jgi:hypothetical protein
MRTTLVAVLVLALTGCRAHFDHTKDGDPLPPEKLAKLQPGSSHLDEALALLGAPDAFGWTDACDVLVYDSWSLRASHWEAENPYSYLTGPITPTSFLGEIPTFVMFVNAKSGAPLPARPPQTPGNRLVPGITFTNKPLTLNGDARGHDQVRLFFERESLLLDRIEVARGSPGNSVGDTAAGTFLK